MQQLLLKRISGLGDPTLLLCASVGLFFYFWIADERRGTSRPWAIALLTCIALIISSKVLFYLLSDTQTGPDRLRSPSGHVAIATTFYGCIAAVLAVGRRQVERVLICLVTVVLLVLLAASRMWLDLHTVPEIVVAFAIGGLCIFAFCFARGRSKPTKVNAAHIIMVLLFTAVTHYLRLDGEGMVRGLVSRIDHVSSGVIGLELRFDRPGDFQGTSFHAK